MTYEASLLFHLLFLVCSSVFSAVCEAPVQHTPLWRDDGEATSLPEWVYFAKCVIKARGCVYVCVCVVHVDNVLLFFLCRYLVKGKIPVRWSSCNVDFREGGL